MGFFKKDGSRIIFTFDNEKLWAEPWGRDSIRIRAAKTAEMPKESWALTEPVKKEGAEIKISEQGAQLCWGKIQLYITKAGKLSFYNEKGKLLLEEYVRNRKEISDSKCSALCIDAREFRPILGGDYSLTMRFEADRKEKLYGMGQYQQPFLDLKGCELELAHRNSQASIPFVISSLGYGFLWNNPAVGRVSFGKNITLWHAESTKILDYWITAGETPAQLVENYTSVTGRVPMMPEYGMGFWQCKLRYQTQEEVLEVAREYKRRNLPISVIVIDFYHWPLEGDWRFDPEYWPNPEKMVRELKDMGIQLMVSVWPTVAHTSENYKAMQERGLLIHVERGYPSALYNVDNTMHMDVTNPETREYVWEIIKKNYYEKGIHIFWLDEAEPEYSVYDFDNYRYYLGTNLQIGNLYPRYYAEMFYRGMEKEGQKNIVNLIRCAWAGSQKFGALVWSGDIHSSFESMRNQFTAGLSMGLCGIPWWTTDIGGFHGGNPSDPAFQELFVRWFEYGTFCPVMRLHGDREPHKQPMSDKNGGRYASGADNEVWSYGEEVYVICKKYLFLREAMKEYIKKAMKQAHESGTPVIRTLFYGFPEDRESWEIEDEYLFGDEILVAPILSAETFQREVYLPGKDVWYDLWEGTEYAGGTRITAAAPLERIPLFSRNAELYKLVQSFNYI